MNFGESTNRGFELGINGVSAEAAQSVGRKLREESRASHALALLIDLDEGPERPDFGGTVCIGIADTSGTVARAEIPRQNYILYSRNSHTFRAVETYFRTENMVLNTVMELGSVETIKELVGAGLGCAVVPRIAVVGKTGLQLEALVAGGAGPLALRPRAVQPLLVVHRNSCAGGKFRRSKLRRTSPKVRCSVGRARAVNW